MQHKIVLDPTKINDVFLSSVEMMALDEFLHRQHIDDMWVMNQEYFFEYNHIQYNFCFTKTLLRRQRKEGKQCLRFEIFDGYAEPLGEGGYGLVYPILGTLQFNVGKPLLKTGKKRIVKIESHDENERSNSVLLEYKNLLQAGHLGVKQPVFVNSNGKKSLLVMKQVDGFPLEKVFHPNKRYKIAHLIPELTVDKRLEITIAMIKAIKEQVIDKGLVHRDLKPGNMMIDFSQSPPKVTIIDYGNAIIGELQENRRVGTAAYRAPEHYNGVPKYTTQSDAYALGRILSYLWGDDYDNYYISYKVSWDEIQKKSSNAHLFSDPQVKLFRKDKELIRHCLSGLLKEDASERITLDDAFAQFSKIDVKKYQLKSVQKLSKTKIDEYEIRFKKQLQTIYPLLAKLSKKSVELKDRGFEDASAKADKLAQQLKRNTEALEQNPDPLLLIAYRKKCLRQISKAKDVLHEHRDANWLIAEITSIVCLLGVCYLVALGVNYHLTGRVGLFSQTKSDQIVDEVKNTICSIPG